MKKIYIMLLALITVLVLAACGNDNEENGVEFETKEPEQAEISDEERMENDQVVAKVNDKEIYGDQYNFIYAQLKTQYQQLEKEMDLDELKSTTMDKIIEEELLAQIAADRGVEVSDEEAQAQIDQLKEEAADNLENILEQFQMEEDDFKKRLQFEMTMEKFQDEQIEVEVTDDEIEDIYEEIKEENEEVPELAEIKSQIRAQIYNEKINEELGKIVEDMKEKSDIDRVIKA